MAIMTPYAFEGMGIPMCFLMLMIPEDMF